MPTEKRRFGRRPSSTEEATAQHLTGGNNKRKAEDAPTDAELVAAANALGLHDKGQARKEWQPRQKKPSNDDEVLDQPCPLHTTRDAEGKLVIPKHTARQCRLIKRAAQNARSGPQQDKEREKESTQPRTGQRRLPKRRRSVGHLCRTRVEESRKDKIQR